MAQLPSTSAGKQDFGFVLAQFAEPGPESPYRRSSERSAALLSPFTFATDVGAATQVDVTLSESDEFRKAKPSLDGKQQQDPISPTQPSHFVRHGQESLDLRSRQEIHQSARLPFWWNC
jgi:hypothetical protein